MLDVNLKIEYRYNETQTQQEFNYFNISSLFGEN